MPTGIGHQLRACGRSNLPAYIRVGGKLYQKVKVFKHDFFAATTLYESLTENANVFLPRQVVLKISRLKDFLGLPLNWLGELICEHEVSILRRIRGLKGVPRLLGRYGRIGLAYEYIPGRSLDERPLLPDDFFDRLDALLRKIHSRNIVYLDLNKRGNVLIGPDAAPYLIDFQISQYIPHRFIGSRRLARFILQTAQKEDLYHLRKHNRQLRRDLMDARQLHDSHKKSLWIRWHRLCTRPFTRIRRRLLYLLDKKGLLITEDTDHHQPETDPNRWR